MFRHTTHHRPKHRRGGVLLVVLVCLVAITALAATLLRIAVTQHRQARLQDGDCKRNGSPRRRSTGAADSMTAPDATSESWSPPQDVLGEPAMVTITRTPVGDDGR